ncbi:hypothetical protein LOZ03_006856, partial [Ophidiomyces ophidiicola]
LPRLSSSAKLPSLPSWSQLPSMSSSNDLLELLSDSLYDKSNWAQADWSYSHLA